MKNAWCICMSLQIPCNLHDQTCAIFLLQTSLQYGILLFPNYLKRQSVNVVKHQVSHPCCIYQGNDIESIEEIFAWSLISMDCMVCHSVFLKLIGYPKEFHNLGNNICLQLSFTLSKHRVWSSVKVLLISCIQNKYALCLYSCALIKEK